MTLLALGVDLASASWADNGSALIELDRDAARFVSVVPGAIAWPSSALTPAALAGAIDAFARSRGVLAVSLDGPAGWRDPKTPPEAPGVGRRCEYECRTQGKTGVYPRTYPSTQRAWIEHCIAVFDALLAKPGVSFARERGALPPPGGYFVLESFPTSTWRASGLAPLPGKGKRPALAPYVEALSAAFGLPAFSPATHDDLQGVVAALAAVAALGGPARALVHGVPPRSIASSDGPRRVEGLIWDAMPFGRRSAAAAVAPTERASTPSACVTSRVLAEVNRTGSSGSMMIAVHGTPGGTAAALVKVALVVDDVEHVLMVGDSHGAWRSHQSDETLASFEALFARLADRPDVRVPLEVVRVVDGAHS